MTNLSDLTPGGGGGAGIDFQEFTTNGTWTKPDDVSWVKIEVIGGGGGGGSGRVGGNANGGNGGGGSPILTGIWAASDVPDSATITIGAGGAGGAAQTADSTNGNTGADGGTSSFGTFFAPDIYGIGGGGGIDFAGFNRYASLGLAWPPHIRGVITLVGGALYENPGMGGQGTSNNSYLRNDSNDANYEAYGTRFISCAYANVCAGGGGAGGVVNGAATYTAGANGGFGQERETTWVPWTTAITEGRNGNDAPTGSTAGGMGGTGNRTGNGGNGGNGGIGSGGGAGAGVPDTYDSGAGGNGGSGRIRVWAW